MKKIIINRLLIVLLFLFESAILLNAETLVKPVDTQNTLFLYIHHLFIPVEGSSSPDSSNDLAVDIVKSNTIFDKYHFIEKGKQGVFDLETTAVYCSYIKRIDAYTEIKTRIPFIYNDGGFMDHTIESFHKAFPGNGLKNGGREYSADNEMHIQYQSEKGGPDINESFYGIGDPSFFLKRILYKNNPGITCSMGIKPEIGGQAFINSGTSDFGLSLNADYKTGLFYFYAMTGYSYFYGKGFYYDELEQCRDYMLSSAIGAGVTFCDSLYFSIQFYLHSSLYETEIEKIDNLTIINSYSVRWKLNDRFILQFCTDEDTFTYAGVDIAFSLRGEYSF